MESKLLIIIDKLKKIEYRLTVIETILSGSQTNSQTNSQNQLDDEVIIFDPALYIPEKNVLLVNIPSVDTKKI